MLLRNVLRKNRVFTAVLTAAMIFTSVPAAPVMGAELLDDVDGNIVLVELGTRTTRCSRNATPVGVMPEYRRLDERRIGDSACSQIGLRIIKRRIVKIRITRLTLERIDVIGDVLGYIPIEQHA